MTSLLHRAACSLALAGAFLLGSPWEASGGNGGEALDGARLDETVGGPLDDTLGPVLAEMGLGLPEGGTPEGKAAADRVRAKAVNEELVAPAAQSGAGEPEAGNGSAGKSSAAGTPEGKGPIAKGTGADGSVADGTGAAPSGTRASNAAVSRAQAAHAGTQGESASSNGSAAKGNASTPGAHGGASAQTAVPVRAEKREFVLRPLTPFTEAVLVRQGRPGLPDITIHYPRFGALEVDRDIALWVNHIADTFERDFGPGAGHGFEAVVDPDLSGDGPEDGGDGYWLSASYTVHASSPSCASVVFDVWMHTGAAQLGQDILTLSYNFHTRRRLDLVDIFEDPDRALRILSDLSRRALAASSERRMDSSLVAGTIPVRENFSSLALTTRGVRVFFQPWQVSRLPGAKSVDIPLDDLLPAKPLLSLWDR